MRARLNLTASFTGRLSVLAAVLACAAYGSPWKVYWSDTTGQAIRRKNPHDMNPATGELVAQTANTVTVRGLAFDPGTDLIAPKMYWTSGGAVFVADIDGTNAASLYTGLSSPTDLVLDVGAGVLSWGSTNGRIYQAPQAGGGPVNEIIIGGGTEIYGIAVGGGTIYWTEVGDWATTGMVRSAALGGPPGGPHADLFTGLAGPVDVEIDTGTGTLYWLEYTSGKLFSGNADGSGAAVPVLDSLNNPAGLALDPILGYAYWTEQGGTGLVKRVRISDSTVQTLYDDTTPWAIALCDPPPQLVPTLTEWGIILLIAVVALSGAAHVAKMRRARA